MRKFGLSGLVAVSIVLCAIVAVAVWPRYVDRSTNVAEAASLPTMAPVVADYQTRDKLVAFWEKAENEHHPGDMISPDHLAEQYLQRYRERMDIDDVLRAERAAWQSMSAQPRGNIPAEMELASINLTLHRARSSAKIPAIRCSIRAMRRSTWKSAITHALSACSTPCR
jgi:uridine phosphorylase